jgi:hypothetical protein
MLRVSAGYGSRCKSVTVASLCSNRPRTRDSEMNQRLLPVAEFRDEARLAYGVLTLLEALRAGRVGSLRERIGSERYRDPGDPEIGERTGR